MYCYRNSLKKHGVRPRKSTRYSWITSFDLIYPNGDDSYLVPFALLRPSDGTILQTMRDGPKRRIVGHKSKMMCITTCDMPLLFKLHPDNENIVSDDDPDMPFPHSAFIRLIIQLIREWKMKPRRALELQYNSAWMTVPNESINLNGFDKCSVSVFLAHYEVSGAILFTVFIEQAVETFKPDHVTSQEGGSVKIAEVLCRIRTTLTDFVHQLHGSERVCPKLFYLPIPPQCNCSQDAADDLLGNASWKIRVKGEGYLPPNPPCACDKTCAIPVNARAWFDKTSRFGVYVRHHLRVFFSLHSTVGCQRAWDPQLQSGAVLNSSRFTFISAIKAVRFNAVQSASFVLHCTYFEYDYSSYSDLQIPSLAHS